VLEEPAAVGQEWVEVDLVVPVVLEGQGVLVDQGVLVVLVVLVLVQEVRWYNRHCLYTLLRSQRCIVLQNRQMGIRRKWTCRPTYSSNIARPQTPATR